MSPIFNVAKDFNPIKKNGWEIKGPGGGGSMFFPTISPHDPATMMITCDMTATYITYDSCKNWTMLNLNGRVDAITFDPTRKGVIYAGSSSLYRSEDNGVSWRLIFPRPETVTGGRFVGDEAMHMYTTNDNLFAGGRVQKIYVSPDNSDHIYVSAATGFEMGFAGKELFLYRSLDNGLSWTMIKKMDGTICKSIIAGSKSDKNKELSGKLYITTTSSLYEIDVMTLDSVERALPKEAKIIKGADSGFDPSTGLAVLYILAEMRFTDDGKMLSGLYRSKDLGNSWAEISGLDVDFYGPKNGQKRIFRNIGVCLSSPQKIYISVIRGAELKDDPNPEMNYSGTLMSNDYGDTWEWSIKISDINPDNVEQGWLADSYNTDWLGSALFISPAPSDPNVCLNSTMGETFLTVDGGKTWSQQYSDKYDDGTWYGKNLECTTCYGVHFDPFNKDNMIISYTDIGMFKSKNGGKTWYQNVTGIPFEWLNTCYDLEFDPDVKGVAWGVWGGLHDLPRIKDFRNNYNQKVPYNVGGVCKTTDGGESWEVTSDGLPSHGMPTHITIDTSTPAGNRTIYISHCGGGVYKSIDNGVTWTEKNNGLEDSLYSFTITILPDGTLYLVNMRALNDNEVVDGALYKSTDGAESWQKLDLPKGVNFPNNFDFDPSNPERLYLACWPTSTDEWEKYGGVYKSEDGGATWQNIFDDKTFVYGIKVDPKHTDHVYIITFEHSAFRSLDRGQTWSRIKGYNFKWGHNPIMDPYNDDMMYITTFGGSVFYGPKAGFDVPFEDIIPIIPISPLA